MCIFWAGYVIAERPFYDSSLNIVEAVNNVFYWMLLVLCFGLTSAVHDKKTLDSNGYIFIFIILLIVTGNAGFMV